jgi:hypothetical protein
MVPRSFRRRRPLTRHRCHTPTAQVRTRKSTGRLGLTRTKSQIRSRPLGVRQLSCRPVGRACGRNAMGQHRSRAPAGRPRPQPRTDHACRTNRRIAGVGLPAPLLALSRPAIPGRRWHRCHLRPAAFASFLPPAGPAQPQFVERFLVGARKRSTIMQSCPIYPGFKGELSGCGVFAVSGHGQRSTARKRSTIFDQRELGNCRPPVTSSRPVARAPMSASSPA